MSAQTAEAEKQDDGVLVATVQKNAREEIRVRLTEYKQYKLVDIRMFFEPENSQKRLPSSKGFAIQRDKLPGLIEALQQAQRMDPAGDVAMSENS